MQFVVKHYGGYTPEEIRLAFELAIEGRLDLKPDQINCYQDFSPAYFARIMSAYRVHRNKEMMRVINERKPDQKLLAPSKLKYYESTLFKSYEKLLAGAMYHTCFSKSDGWILYSSLEEIGIFNFSDGEKRVVWNKLIEDQSWFNPTGRNKKLKKSIFINESKHVLFKQWIYENKRNGIDIRDLIMTEITKM